MYNVQLMRQFDIKWVCFENISLYVWIWWIWVSTKRNTHLEQPPTYSLFSSFTIRSLKHKLINNFASRTRIKKCKYWLVWNRLIIHCTDLVKGLSAGAIPLKCHCILRKLLFCLLRKACNSPLLNRNGCWRLRNWGAVNTIWIKLISLHLTGQRSLAVFINL